MRVMHVTDLYPPFIGGMEQHVRRLSEETVRRGHDVCVATVRLPDTPAFADEDGVEVNRLPATVARLPGAHESSAVPFLPPMRDPHFTRALRALVAQWRPDVIHTHGWSNYSSLHPEIVKSAPVVFTMHDYAAICARKTLTKPGHEICSGPSVRSCLPCASEQYGAARGAALTLSLRASRPRLDRCDAIVGVSRSLLEAHRPFLPEGVPTSVIPPFLVPPTTVPARPAWVPDEPYVMYVGALTAHKGLDIVLDAVHTARSRPHLLAIGTRRADTPTEWPDNVTVREGERHETVLAAWAHATAGIVPSMWPEPFGLVAVEAMTFGVPPIVSDTGGLPAIVEHGEAGLVVPPGDPGALAAALDELADDPRLRQRLSDRARVAAGKYTADVVVTQNLDLYESVVANGSTARRRGPVRSSTTTMRSTRR